MYVDMKVTMLDGIFIAIIIYISHVPRINHPAQPRYISRSGITLIPGRVRFENGVIGELADIVWCLAALGRRCGPPLIESPKKIM